MHYLSQRVMKNNISGPWSYQGPSKVSISSDIGSGGPERVEDGQGFLKNMLRVDAELFQQRGLVGELVVDEVAGVGRVVGTRRRGHEGRVARISSRAIVSIKTCRLGSCRVVEALVLLLPAGVVVVLVPAAHFDLGAKT